MKRFFSYIFISLSMLMVSLPSWATTVDEITGKLETPMVVMTKILLFACYVVGAILIFAAIAQYRNHKQSPKLVPLTTPVILLILGICLLLVPYFTTLAKDTASLAEQQKREGREDPGSGIFSQPQDDESQLGPGYLPEDDPIEPYPDDDADSGGGHWSDQYR